MCAGCAPRLLFFSRSWHGKSIQLCTNLQQLGVRLSRARDFCWGSPRPDGKMHVGAPRVSIPGLAGLGCPLLWCLGHFLSLGKGQGGALKGPKGSAIQRHRPHDGRCGPRVVTVRAHRPQTASPAGPDATGGWMIKLTDPANQTTKPSSQLVSQPASPLPNLEVVMLTLMLR